jgi:amino acid permease
MNPVVAVIAMVNGMIGGLILILPILALNGGTVLSFIVISITGFFSYYSCYLCVAHLGSYSDLDKAIFNHFNQSKTIKILYDIMVCVNLVFILLLYFNLIVEQWNGLVGQSIAIPIANAFGLLILVSGLKYLNFGAKLLGYGIISIISYCIFLIWLLATAPSGPKKIP